MCVCARAGVCVRVAGGLGRAGRVGPGARTGGRRAAAAGYQSVVYALLFHLLRHSCGFPEESAVRILGGDLGVVGAIASVGFALGPSATAFWVRAEMPLLFKPYHVLVRLRRCVMWGDRQFLCLVPFRFQHPRVRSRFLKSPGLLARHRHAAHQPNPYLYPDRHGRIVAHLVPFGLLVPVLVTGPP